MHDISPDEVDDVNLFTAKLSKFLSNYAEENDIDNEKAYPIVCSGLTRILCHLCINSGIRPAELATKILASYAICTEKKEKIDKWKDKDEG